ncbi:hypothetical protein BKA70DRAFT_1106844, partial [Coprinopsis sp. MPI-PUGE-AT-0042]
ILHLELPHINVLLKIDLQPSYGELAESFRHIGIHYIVGVVPDFNLDFYTEVQDLSYLENSLNASLPPKYAALNMAMISLVEDFSLVGFETLAVEDKNSTMHLTHAIDRATGYVFVPPPGAPAPPDTVSVDGAPPTARPNTYGLFSSAAGPLKDPGGDVRDVQGRWINYRDIYDAHQNGMWRKEGEMVRE